MPPFPRQMSNRPRYQHLFKFFSVRHFFLRIWSFSTTYSQNRPVHNGVGWGVTVHCTLTALPPTEACSLFSYGVYIDHFCICFSTWLHGLALSIPGPSTSLSFHVNMQTKLVPSIAKYVTVTCSTPPQHKPIGLLLYISYVFLPFTTFIRKQKLLLFATKIFSVITFPLGIIHLRKSTTINKSINKNSLLLNLVTITLKNGSIQFRKIRILAYFSIQLIKIFQKNIHSGEIQPVNVTHLHSYNCSRYIQ
jgi:hypothetical protein